MTRRAPVRTLTPPPAESGHGYWIASPRQVEALRAPVRQEIIDAVSAAGPSTISTIAAQLGRRPDGLYFHVRLLAKVGLLVEQGQTGSGRKAAAVYDVPGRPMRLRYDPSDRRGMSRIGNVVDGVLRLAQRDFRRSVAGGRGITAGPGRNTYCGRVRGWLTPSELVRANDLIAELFALVSAGREPAASPARQSIAVTVAIVPVDAKPRALAHSTPSTRNPPC